MEKYNPKEIEPKWQRFWENHPELYSADDKSKKDKQYVLDMFPYPSGDGLHVGHVESYTATDIISRYLRMNKKNILHPQGWDAFGLPAENYAIKTKVHPAETTKKSIATFKNQMKKLGFSYDWSREINSSDPEYYRWTQWFFLLLYKNGLVYRDKARVNFCPKCQTVLANEQAEGGKCERCDTKVIQKDLEQWFFKITDFIEDKPRAKANIPADVGTSVGTSGLISGLEKVDWPESTKAAQKNWIGKSVGAQFKMPVVIAIRQPAEKQSNNSKIAASPTAPRNDVFIEVYTTRLDTVYGMTYAVVAPEHPLLQNKELGIGNYGEVEEYIKKAKNKTELERMETKEKTGVEVKGVKVINPFNNEEIPLFVADYVVGGYGTGAVMAVPAHDERDWEFAKENNLPVKYVIEPDYKNLDIKEISFEFAIRLREGLTYEESLAKTLKYQYSIIKQGQQADFCFTGDGILIKSNNYNDLTSQKAREEMVKWLEKEKIGSKKINYKLRDWLVSRQRYWGAPIPIIYCRKCWENSKLQIPNPKQIPNSNNQNFQTTEIDSRKYAIIPVPDEQLPVKLPDDVDFQPTGESPLKHSKSFHKVVCPVCGSNAKRESDTMDTFVCSSWYYFRYTDPKNKKEFASRELIKKWLPVDLYVGGAEHTVLHLLYSRFFTKVLHNLVYINFDEPFLKLRHQGTILGEDNYKMSKSRGNVVNPDKVMKEYSADALRMFEMFMGPLEDMKPWNMKGIVGISRFLNKVWNLQFKLTTHNPQPTTKFENLLHKTIKKVTEDVENLRFNTAISSLMILVNELEKQKELSVVSCELLVKLLSPFAPHITEELWSKLGHKESIFKESWPNYDPKLIKDEEIDLVIQVNGKVRDTIKSPADVSEEEAKKLAMASKKVKKFTEGKEIKKAIFVKGKLINLVVS